jgi:hypothetical protein
MPMGVDPLDEEYEQLLGHGYQQLILCFNEF